MQFVQRRADGFNDPVFGTISDIKKPRGSITKKGNRGNKVTAMSTVVEGQSYSQQISDLNGSPLDSIQQ